MQTEVSSVNWQVFKMYHLMHFVRCTQQLQPYFIVNYRSNRQVSGTFIWLHRFLLEVKNNGAIIRDCMTHQIQQRWLQHETCEMCFAFTSWCGIAAEIIFSCTGVATQAFLCIIMYLQNIYIFERIRYSYMHKIHLAINKTV